MVATLTKPVERLSLAQMDYLSIGKRARLHRMLYQFGPGNGTFMFLPMDQGLEHGPVDFFINPPCEDPNYQCRLARDGGYSAVVFQIGVAEKYMREYAGQIPLVLKLNGKTNIPSDDEAFSPLTGSVEDAVRLGADAVGYTLYVGSPSQDRDIRQFNEVRREAERYGMPVIMWAYPRGRDIERKGGKESLYAIDYAARVATELGADVVKVNYPKLENPHKGDSPKPYNELTMEFEEALRKIVHSAGKTMIVFSGGSKISDQELLERVQQGMNAGGTGIIFGRNMWQRPMEEALRISRAASDIMRNSR